ncbi:sensor domain-containing protein [Cellulomonas sp. P24]|uniref:sensor domain-containing protein n=1 Tax=Cellulomonas sp. P24 TaxID=2885206 RepID=UPI00216B42E3|nr:sensor domain-containing protein [Cellulomonas sp. P24]MCR6491122.1 sensor domain-containing protein [Cellulomonas sp. P24]
MSVTAAPLVPPSASTSAPDARTDSWSPWSRCTWLASAHLLLDLPVGMLWGTLVVALLASSIGLMPLALLGVPLLVVTLAGSLLAARAEHARTRMLLGAAPVAPVPLPRTATGWLRLLADGRAWLSCLYAVVLLPLGIVNATVTFTGWAVVAAGLTSQVWAWLLPTRAVTVGTWVVDGEPAVIATTALAVLLAIAMPRAVRLLAAVDRWLVRTLLR